MNGWRAECLSCPTVKGGFGEVVRVGVEHTGHDACGKAEAWRTRHRKEEPMHLVRVCGFTRIEISVEFMIDQIKELIFGDG